MLLVPAALFVSSGAQAALLHDLEPLARAQIRLFCSPQGYRRRRLVLAWTFASP